MAEACRRGSPGGDGRGRGDAASRRWGRERLLPPDPAPCVGGWSDEREGLRGREEEGGGPAAAGVAREAAASEPSPFSIQIGIDGGGGGETCGSGEWARSRGGEGG